MTTQTLPVGATTGPELPTLDQYRNMIAVMRRREVSSREEAELWRLRAVARWQDPVGAGRRRLEAAAAEAGRLTVGRKCRARRDGGPRVAGRAGGAL